MGIFYFLFFYFCDISQFDYVSGFAPSKATVGNIINDTIDYHIKTLEVFYVLQCLVAVKYYVKTILNCSAARYIYETVSTFVSPYQCS